MAGAKSDRVAAQKLASALREVPDNRLACRGRMHAWELEHDFHVYEQWQERAGSKTPHIRRTFYCLRDCGVRAIEHFILGRYGIERVSRGLDYSGAIGYQIPGVPRGVKPLHIVQQEEYRRAMEKAAHSARGDRASSDGDLAARRADRAS